MTQFLKSLFKSRVFWALVIVSGLGTGYIAFLKSQVTSEFQEAGFFSESDIPAVSRAFESDLKSFQSLIEESLAWRASALREIERLKSKVDSGQALQSGDLKYLHDGALIYLNIRTGLLKLAHKYKSFAAENFEIEWKPGEGTKLLRSGNKGSVLQLDPLDRMGDLLIRQFKLSLASALTLYDNFLLAIWPYQEDSRFRILINYDNAQLLKGLEVVTKNYLDSDNRKMVHRAAEYFYLEQQWRKEKGEPSHEYLDTLIGGSPTLYVARNKSWVFTGEWKFDQWATTYMDAFQLFRQESLNLVSGLFGNTVGLVETRKGKLFDKGQKFIKALEGQLKPLDILLEKTPFRLTDKFIPGHFGHVAVWMGHQQEIQQLGVNLNKEHKGMVKNGQKVLEALRSGVQLSSLQHFLNVDDLVVIRLEGIERENFKKYLELAVEQIGKDYDFNFDVETDKKIVCSELAYVVFPDIEWPLGKSVGRFTISPDNVAQAVLNNQQQFSIPIFYHDGIEVSENRFQALHGLLKNGEL